MHIHRLVVAALAGAVSIGAAGCAKNDRSGIADAGADGAPDASDQLAADAPADAAPSVDAPPPDAPSLECEVVIIGAGAGGLHTAFRLAPALHERVCLFEKEEELGGRIHDVALDASDPNSPRFGTGARRVMEGQALLFGLADELNMTLEMPATAADLIVARGTYGFAKDDFIPLYPRMAVNPMLPDPDQETWLYDKLRIGPARATVTDYADFRSYIRAIVGGEGWEFLHDMSRFRADFEYPLDARGYLDYLDEEWDACCTPSYPVGGMSSFIRGMEAKAIESGARIFKGEPVASIDKIGDRYFIRTAKQTVNAQKIVVAVPPAAFDHIKGDVAERIQAQAQYQQILGVRVVTVTQWWPSNWWSTIRNPAAATNGQVWRAWSTEHCFNFIEIPLEPYGVNQLVTRSVYDDDIACVQFWEELAKKGTAAVEAEIKRGLQHAFVGNGKSLPAMVEIPNPIKTHVQVWPAAWHWLRAGATFTNADIADWAVEPLAGEPVALVGEAYYLNRSGWSEAAYKSSIKLLNAKYGMSLWDGKSPAAKPVRSPRQTRSEAGH